MCDRDIGYLEKVDEARFETTFKGVTLKKMCQIVPSHASDAEALHMIKTNLNGIYLFLIKHTVSSLLLRRFSSIDIMVWIHHIMPFLGDLTFIQQKYRNHISRTIRDYFHLEYEYDTNDDIMRSEDYESDQYNSGDCNRPLMSVKTTVQKKYPIRFHGESCECFNCEKNRELEDNPAYFLLVDIYNRHHKVPKKFAAHSQLNGANGEWTGSDDLDHADRRRNRREAVNRLRHGVNVNRGRNRGGFGPILLAAGLVGGGVAPDPVVEDPPEDIKPQAMEDVDEVNIPTYGSGDDSLGCCWFLSVEIVSKLITGYIMNSAIVSAFYPQQYLPRSDNDSTIEVRSNHDPYSKDWFAKIGYNSSYTGLIYKKVYELLFREFASTKGSSLTENTASRIFNAAMVHFETTYHQDSYLDEVVLTNTINYLIGRIKINRLKVTMCSGSREVGIDRVGFN